MIAFKIALRFLKSGRGQTMLIIIGIAIAISVQIFVGLLIDSLQRTLVESTIGSSPHVTISSATDVATISRWENILGDIENIGPAKATLLSVSSNAFAKKGANTAPVLIRGFDFNDANKIYGFADAIYEGTFYSSRREIVVGSGLQEELELNLGDKVTVRTSSGAESSFTVTGFYRLGIASIDKSWIITRLETAQSIFGFGNRLTEIEITVSDPFDADNIARKIERRIDNEDISVENWKDANQQLLGGLEGQRVSSTIIQIVILISVVVAIASVLAITVLQKSRQLGILKAMGIKDRTASMIFIYQGFLIGLLGSLVGIALGLGMLIVFSQFTVNPDGSQLVDVFIDRSFIIRSWLIGVLASTIAAIIPARRSMKLNPVDVIREG
jgi:lipoprotein-releasing system permease protein